MVIGGNLIADLLKEGLVSWYFTIFLLWAYGFDIIIDFYSNSFNVFNQFIKLFVCYEITIICFGKPGFCFK